MYIVLRIVVGMSEILIAFDNECKHTHSHTQTHKRAHGSELTNERTHARTLVERSKSAHTHSHSAAAEKSLVLCVRGACGAQRAVRRTPRAKPAALYRRCFRRKILLLEEFSKNRPSSQAILELCVTTITRLYTTLIQTIP